jgi:peptide methionine sulfoxide reductase MsrB
MEYKYKIMDPKQLTQGSEYGIYGTIALLAVIQQTYGQLIATNDWPALSINLPESNIAFKTPTSTKLSNTTIRCFRCGENHHIRNCPQPDNMLTGEIKGIL